MGKKTSTLKKAKKKKNYRCKAQEASLVWHTEEDLSRYMSCACQWDKLKNWFMMDNWVLLAFLYFCQSFICIPKTKKVLFKFKFMSQSKQSADHLKDARGLSLCFHVQSGSLYFTNMSEHSHEYSPHTSGSAVLVHLELSSLYWLCDLRGHNPDGAKRTAGHSGGFTGHRGNRAFTGLN